MIKIVVIDGNELVRDGLVKILVDRPGLDLVGKAGNGDEGLRLIRRLVPDVALVDIHTDGMSGLELMHRVMREQLHTRVVMLAVVNNVHLPRRIMDAGATGYLTKDSSTDELYAAVSHAARGQRYLAPVVAQRMALSTMDGEDSPFAALSGRELEVALMLVRGHSLGAIGERLHLSPKTVSTYKQRLFDKLGVNHVIGLLQMMVAFDLLDTRKLSTA